LPVVRTGATATEIAAAAAATAAATTAAGYLVQGRFTITVPVGNRPIEETMVIVRSIP
jgi:hypothetical protein